MTSLAAKFVSQISRIAPFGKRNDDPLTNLKAVTRWLEALPLGDAFKCQQAILGQLKRFDGDPTHFTKDRLPVFMLLDEKSRDLQDTLVRQYLRNPRMSRQVESQLWHAVYGMYWEIARGYHTFVLNLSREAGKNGSAGPVPLITLRAIRAFGQLLKWRAIRYLPPSEKLWLRLHNLYRITEDMGVHRMPQQAYDDDASPCNCETAYLHILMMNLANSGSLYPKQLDLLDRWLFGWHDMLQLDTQFDASAHQFVIDLSADHGPRRVRKPEPDKPLRFWSTTALLQNLQEIKTVLREGGAPPQLGSIEIARNTENLELLDFLEHQWGILEAREQRRAPRATVKRLVDVAHGLNAIMNQIKAATAPASVSPYGTGLNYNEADDVQVYGFITDRTRERVSHLHAPTSPHLAEVERWVMHDESQYGYGAVVQSRDKDWLRVGALLGIKSHDADQWRIGIIRRLTRLNDDTSSVGIETVVEVPALTMLYDISTPGYTVNGIDNTGATLPHSGIWLDGDPGTVLIDPIHFAPGKIFKVKGMADRDLVSLSSPIEHCEGWVRVKIEPVKK